MPWTVQDVDRHYRGLTDHEKRMWVDVANQQLAAHGDEGRAISEANAVVTRYRQQSVAGGDGGALMAPVTSRRFAPTSREVVVRPGRDVRKWNPVGRCRCDHKVST